jgi:hypothetical protein
MRIFEKIDLLPSDIRNYCIKPYLSLGTILFTCKKYYENNIMKYRLTNNKYLYKKYGLTLDSYIKKIIIKKFDYIFSLLVKEKYGHWKKIKRYKYKDYRFKTYIDVLIYLCIDNDSTKCRNHIISYEKNNDTVRKNKYKKMKRINNRWNN